MTLKPSKVIEGARAASEALHRRVGKEIINSVDAEQLGKSIMEMHVSGNPEWRRKQLGYRVSHEQIILKGASKMFMGKLG